MKKVWNVAQKTEGLNPYTLIQTILQNRGINDKDEFMSPKEDCLLPFSLFKNIDKAYETVRETLVKHGKILIYADVDTDGCTSVAIMYRWLRNFTENVETVINSGKAHGIQADFDYSKLDGVSLLIIVDAIQNDTEAYKTILNKGCKLVVLDHHIVPDDVLAMSEDICLVSSAVDNYPNPELSGAGVVWKFCKYLDEKFGVNIASSLSDLAATGIVADVCDVGQNAMENRYICHKGFEATRNHALNYIVGEYNFNSTSVAFSIAPLVNCANRLGRNDRALRLFLTDDYLEIEAIVKELKDDKELQKQTVAKLYKSAVSQLEKQKNNKCLWAYVTGAENLGGLIATKISSEYGRPSIVITDSDGTNYSGSMRAVGIKDFRSVLNECDGVVCNGHEQAAGVSIACNKLDSAYKQVEELLKDYEFENVIDIDAEIPVDWISKLAYETTELNRISGKGFKPIQYLVELDNSKTEFSTRWFPSVGKHLSFTTKSPKVQFIKWNCDANVDLNATRVKCVGTIESGIRNNGPQMILNEFEQES